MKQLVQAFAEIVSDTEAEILSQLQAVDANIVTLHYEHGHYTEIHQTLTQFNNSKSFYNKKYPLIALLEDVPAKVVKGIAEYRFTVIICYSSKNDSKAEKRYEEVINPILEPIYSALVGRIEESGYFYGYHVPHDKIIRPFMGVQAANGNQANIFSDVLDCIEMKNIVLKMYPEGTCETKVFL